MDTSFPKRVAVDIEASAFGLDFAVPGADATRVVQYHDETVVDIKAGDYPDVEKRIAAAVMEQQRQLAKMAAHGAAYGHGAIGSGAAGAAPNAYWTQATKTRTTKTDRVVQRELRVAAAHTKSLKGLDDNERRWAEAFFEVMRASPDHYARAEPARKRFLEKHYAAVAQENSKRGQRAAKVLVHVVSHAIEGREPEPDFAHIEKMAQHAAQNSWYRGPTMTGRMVAAAPAKQSIPKDAGKIFGNSATRIIMDDLA